MGWIKKSSRYPFWNKSNQKEVLTRRKSFLLGTREIFKFTFKSIP